MLAVRHDDDDDDDDDDIFRSIDVSFNPDFLEPILYSLESC